MKAYQDHDPVADKGKAEPKPQVPNPIRTVSRFEEIHPQPRTSRRQHEKPSRGDRIRATAERKKAMRKLMMPGLW